MFARSPHKGNRKNEWKGNINSLFEAVTRKGDHTVNVVDLFTLDISFALQRLNRYKFAGVPDSDHRELKLRDGGV